MRPKSIHLLDLDQNLLISICRMLSVRDNLQLRLVSRRFVHLLDEPAPGCGIWGVVNLDEFSVDRDLDQLYRHAIPRL